MSGGDDAIAVGHACGDDGRIAGGRADLDGTRLHGVILRDDPGEQPLRSALDRGIGDGDRVVARFHQHPGIDEFARPERVVGVGKHRLEPDGGRCRVDGVVDQQQRAGAQGDFVVLVECRYLDRAAALRPANLIDIGRRQRENDGAGLRQHQIGERFDIGGMYHVARIDQPDADAAVAWRLDIGVVELCLGRLDRRGVGSNQGLGLIHLRSLLIDVLLGFDVFEDQSLGADEVLLDCDQCRFVLRLLGFGLVERSLKQARVDLGEAVSLFDVLAFGEQHQLQFAVDLGADVDAR